MRGVWAPGGRGGGHVWRSGRGERGSASMLMVGVMGVVLLLGSAGIVVTSYLVAYHRVRAAADLAALSGATAYARGEDACDQALETARGNGVAVLDCAQTGDLVDFVVSVSVTLEVRIGLAGLPRSVGAAAHAGPVR